MIFLWHTLHLVTVFIINNHFVGPKMSLLHSRLITCKHEGILFVDKNEIDLCGNSPLVLAIRLRNMDAVKILTDLHCSSKLSPLPNILNGFELSKAIKDRRMIELLL